MCFLFDHKYFIAQELNSYSRRMCCGRCHQSFAMNDDTQILIDWDSSFHRMYERHGVEIKYLPIEFRANSESAS